MIWNCLSTKIWLKKSKFLKMQLTKRRNQWYLLTKYDKMSNNNAAKAKNKAIAITSPCHSVFVLIANL